MKKLSLLTIIIMLATVYVSFGQISGSAHDFSTRSWNSSSEICNTCHTPHNAIASVEPLWNHELSTATYNMYTSTTFDAAATIGTAPDGSSKLCLSCHDGTVAVDNYQGNGAYTPPGVLISDASFLLQTGDLGTDMRNDHPISFTYDAALVTADGGGLNDPGTLDPAIHLESGKLQCASCHDVHSNPLDNHFLVMSNAGSALCLECHAK